MSSFPRLTLHVSIHAPAQGATQHLHPHPELMLCFNPRPRAGGDAAKRKAQPARERFNPRPRAGGDSVCVHSTQHY